MRLAVSPIRSKEAIGKTEKRSVLVRKMGALASVLFAGAVTASTLALSTPASADAAALCVGKAMTWGLNEGARSYCPSKPSQYTHRIHITCAGSGGNYNSTGPYAGGRSNSDATCIGFDNLVNFWVEEFSEPPLR
ncbi:hypothetical protein AB0K40_25470 [Nonomuraea bangladeshensis]|uniref:Secreted protein n=1 Tax=Nonomuraea bangladeshensis TaxID=404385 RepID=A0ABV3H8M1_9ACTN